MSEKNLSNLSTPIAIVLAGVMIAGSVIYTNMTSGSSPAGTGGDTFGAEQFPERTPPQPVDMATINTADYPSLGNADAPITIVEYSDFACPFCQNFWAETLPQIKEQYVDMGIVRFVYKDFPVVGGDKAAEASHCAREQGKYWEYHDVLFENQTADRASWGNSDVHRRYAEAIGINADELVDCFESGRHSQFVVSAAQEAAASGGQGTPFFLVNGIPVEGAQPFSTFQSIINGLLNE